jgi:hypothetical protein
VPSLEATAAQEGVAVRQGPKLVCLWQRSLAYTCPAVAPRAKAEGSDLVQQTGMTNQWLKEQGLVSVKELWVHRVE